MAILRSCALSSKLVFLCTEYRECLKVTAEYCMQYIDRLMHVCLPFLVLESRDSVGVGRNAAEIDKAMQKEMQAIFE